MKRILLAALTMFVAVAAQAAEVSRIVVGFPPGQATDIIARLIGERIGPLLGETFIVEIVPGRAAALRWPRWPSRNRMAARWCWHRWPRWSPIRISTSRSVTIPSGISRLWR